MESDRETEILEVPEPQGAEAAPNPADVLPAKFLDAMGETKDHVDLAPAEGHEL